MLHGVESIGKFKPMRLLVAMLIALVTTGCSLPRWPVHAPLSSPYGIRFLGWRPDFHDGVDIPLPIGTAISAMKSGDVAFAGEQPGYGLVVVLQHGRNVRTVYAHLSRISVKTGQPVKAGEVIGLSGRSGNATGAHLHFEIRRWGRAEDPVTLLGGPPHR
jgi:murein DD-endopeptidase MepM/ murein hydrolase activator NlpD